MKERKIIPTILVVVMFVLFALHMTVWNLIRNNSSIPNEIKAILGEPIILLAIGIMILTCIWAIKEKNKRMFVIGLLMGLEAVGLLLVHIGKTAVVGMFLATIPAFIGSIYVIKCCITNTGFKKPQETSVRVGWCLLFLVAAIVSICFTGVGVKDAAAGTKKLDLYSCYIKKASQGRALGSGYDYLIGYDEKGNEYKLKILDLDATEIKDGNKLTVEFYENMEIVVEVLP